MKYLRLLPTEEEGTIVINTNIPSKKACTGSHLPDSEGFYNGYQNNFVISVVPFDRDSGRIERPIYNSVKGEMFLSTDPSVVGVTGLYEVVGMCINGLLHMSKNLSESSNEFKMLKLCADISESDIASFVNRLNG